MPTSLGMSVARSPAGSPATATLVKVSGWNHLSLLAQGPPELLGTAEELSGPVHPVGRFGAIWRKPLRISSVLPNATIRAVRSLSYVHVWL